MTLYQTAWGAVHLLYEIALAENLPHEYKAAGRDQSFIAKLYVYGFQSYASIWEEGIYPLPILQTYVSIHFHMLSQ